MHSAYLQRRRTGRRGQGVLPPPLAQAAAVARRRRNPAPPPLPAAPAAVSARQLQAIKPAQFAPSLYDALVLGRLDSFRALVDVGAATAARCPAVLPLPAVRIQPAILREFLSPPEPPCAAHALPLQAAGLKAYLSDPKLKATLLAPDGELLQVLAELPGAAGGQRHLDEYSRHTANHAGAACARAVAELSALPPTHAQRVRLRPCLATAARRV